MDARVCKDCARGQRTSPESSVSARASCGLSDLSGSGGGGNSRGRLDGPLQIVMAAAAGMFASSLMRGSKHDGDWSHLVIVGLAISLAGFATWTVMLLGAGGKRSALAEQPKRIGQPYVKIESPPSHDIVVREKFSGVKGFASNLPQGETIWLMSQTVGDARSYLIGEPCAIAESGHWSCPPVYFGTSEPNYQHYYILVRALKGKTLQQVIEEWGNVRSEGKNALSFAKPIGFHMSLTSNAACSILCHFFDYSRDADWGPCSISKTSRGTFSLASTRITSACCS